MVTVTSKLLDVFWCKCIFSCVQIKVGCLPPCICHWISMRVNHQFCCLHLNPVEVHCLKDARLSHCQALQAPWLLHSLVSFFVNLQGTFVTELGMFECLASDWNFCLHLNFGMHTHTHIPIRCPKISNLRLFWDALPSSHSQPEAATLQCRLTLDLPLYACFCRLASLQWMTWCGCLDWSALFMCCISWVWIFPALIQKQEKPTHFPCSSHRAW